MATIYDVAQAAGVSAKTVSRVLNADGPVNARTREAVETAIDRLGYVPSNAARMMRSNRSGLVGLITGAISSAPTDEKPGGLPDIQILQGIQAALAEAGIILLISDTAGRTDAVPRLVRALRGHQVEGIFFVADHHLEISLPTEAQARNMVLVNCFDASGTPAVLPDDEDGQYRLTAALIARGHRRIGFLTLPENLVAHHLRLAGYRRALAGAGIPYDPALVFSHDDYDLPDEARHLAAALGRLMALTPPPSVLLCGNDRLAVGVYGQLRARGVQIPGEMSVAGYDDYRVISESLYPPLTTVELPYRQMGKEAAQMMLNCLRSPEDAIAAGPVRVRGAVKWRGSVLPLAAKETELETRRNER